MALPPVLRFAVPALAALALIAGPTILSSSASGGAPALGADLQAPTVRPGQPLHVTGSVPGQDSVKLQVSTPDGALRGPYGPFPVRDGRVDATLPAAATAGIEPTKATSYREVLGIQAVDAGTSQTSSSAADTGGAAAEVAAAPAGPVLENSFVSSKGWVKPGDAYPLTLRIRNYQPTPADGGVVTVPPVAGMSFTRVLAGDGARIEGGNVVWAAGVVPATTDPAHPGVRTLVVEAKAATTTADPQIVWKNLSTTATSTTAGTSRSHGPKVIPPSETYDTARYGDRPFPVVPVEFVGRPRDAASTADKLSTKINDPGNAGSTYNLYQEMSYGQLFPHGTVPSDGIATADWASYKPGFAFTHTEPGQTCQSPTTADLPGDVYQSQGPRIKDGWYQLPGTTGYYGSDAYGSALIGAETGVGALQSIDAGCGPAAKAVFDAAQISDPEIDYDDYDTDKDGVVDFFMMIFVGLGGNGESQLNGVPPYDNIWPHSSTLESSYTDSHGQKGYVTDDQRTDVDGRRLWYTDDSFTRTTTSDMGDALKALVRVGPYNVNPETAIAKASVISHEYGHSLGLPDYYSTGSRSTYGTWNLMAEDHSQHMDVNGRQELGWLVPRVLAPGQRLDAKGVGDSTRNTHRIDWQTPGGQPYTLSGDGVDNGEAYAAKLKQRQVLDPKIVPSGNHVQWSQAGNDFGCPPTKGHNLDLDLRSLKGLPAGTKVTLSFKSAFQTEWDFDYGFVLSTTDGGKTYHSYASQKGYTTAGTQNPNSNDCQRQYGNGITGSPDAYDAGTAPVDRVRGVYSPLKFVDDSYDISDLVGTGGVVRFAYATDPGLAKPGWFIDDVKVTAGDRVIYSSDFERPDDPQLYNGGCRENLQTATKCTHGWAYTAATENDPADHAYYLELRDRAGFDLDGHGEDDRASGPSFQGGLSLVYTDENHGYGNVGTDDPPAQTPVDAKPESKSETPNLDDAAFTASRNTFSDAGQGYLDNYTDPAAASGEWRHAFDCLGFRVARMAGDGNGPGTAPGDLNADIAFTGGPNCQAFDYGYGRGTNEVATPGVTSAADAAGKLSACAASKAYRRVRLKHSGRGLRFDVATLAGQRFRVDVFSGKRLVARFSNRRRAFSWNGRVKGKRKLRDGYYVVRVTASRSGGNADVRHFAVRRLHGRYGLRPAIESTPSTCSAVRSYRAVAPTFSTKKGRALDLRYSLGARGTASLTVLRGKKKPKVVKRLATRTRAANKSYRQLISARKLPKGDLRIVLHVKAGDASVTRTITARRI